jgi:hypothetical protein
VSASRVIPISGSLSVRWFECVLHVQDAHAALEELRCVAKRRLIVVLPKQRPYRYTFDLHLRFFPLFAYGSPVHVPDVPPGKIRSQGNRRRNRQVVNH